MQLLHSCSAVPAVPEFAALSLLLADNGSYNNNNNTTEPLLVASTASTVTKSAALESIRELHRHVRSIVEASASSSASSSKPEKDSSASASQQSLFASELLREEERSLRSKMQIYRTTRQHGGGGGGLALHYRWMRGPESAQLQAVIHNNSNNTNSNATETTTATTDPSILGVILCVGVAGGGGGSGTAHSSSETVYSLEQRLSDCTGFILQRRADAASAQSLMATFLLADHSDDCRVANDRARAPETLVLPNSGSISGSSAQQQQQAQGGKALLSPMVAGMQMMSPIADFRLASRRTNVGKPQQNGEPDDDMNGSGGITDPDHPWDAAAASAAGLFPLQSTTSADAARTMTNRLSVLAVAESGTLLRPYGSAGAERRAQLDLSSRIMSSTKSRFLMAAASRRRNKPGAAASDAPPELDANFDYKGPARKKASQQQRSTATAMPPALPAPEMLQFHQSQQSFSGGAAGSSATSKAALKSSRKDTRSKTTGRAARGVGGGGGLGAHMATKQRGNAGNTSRQQHHHFDDESHQSVDTRSQSGHGSANSAAHLQVNIALNEDLTCSYKLSQLSSCNVEGVAQIQVKSTGRTTNIPFAFLIRDPSSHIDTLTENKKLADDVTDSQNGQGDAADYKFNLLIPKHEQYFPVLKYKCTGELRPVPIRVQAKVKVDEAGGFCRVALQISSNPNNAASLSDLTIVMGVPNMIRGETLATQPPGGVWDEAKSSVIWCVSELGSGEKFQLQARFEVGDPAPLAEELSFPVLVRCQCLYVQLSDIEFDVRERPEAYPAEIAMKIARRFRLSHRERNG